MLEESKNLLLLLPWSLLYLFLKRGKTIPTRTVRLCLNAQKVALVALVLITCFSLKKSGHVFQGLKDICVKPRGP